MKGLAVSRTTETGTKILELTGASLNVVPLAEYPNRGTIYKVRIGG